MSNRANRQLRRARQRRIDPDPPELIDAYQRATRLFVSRDRTPAYRIAKRRRLERELVNACNEADRIRDALADKRRQDRGPGLLELLGQFGAGLTAEATDAAGT